MDSDKPDNPENKDSDISGPASIQEQLQEQLSAFVDGELPVEEVELLLRRLERDAGHRQRFSRYVTIGSLMRGEVGPAQRQSDRIRAGVMQEVTQIEETVEVQTTASPQSKKQSQGKLISFAVAAGLCAVAVMNILPNAQQAGVQIGQVAAVEQGADQSVSIEDRRAEYAQAGTQFASRNSEATREVTTRDVNREARRSRQVVRSDRMASYLASHGTHARTISWRVAEPAFVVNQAGYTTAAYSPK